MSAHPRQRNGIITVIANPTTAATIELVAAQATGIKIEVVALKVVSSGVNTVTLKSASTAIGTADDLTAGGGYVLPFNDNGWMRTAAAEALNITLSAALKVSVHLQYRLTK
jgi:hypothetical protein